LPSFFKLYLRTTKKQSLVAFRSTPNATVKEKLISELLIEMSRWHYNTNLFANDPLEIHIEEERFL